MKTASTLFGVLLVALLPAAELLQEWNYNGAVLSGIQGNPACLELKAAPKGKTPDGASVQADLPPLTRFSAQRTTELCVKAKNHAGSEVFDPLLSESRSGGYGWRQCHSCCRRLADAFRFHEENKSRRTMAENNDGIHRFERICGNDPYADVHVGRISGGRYLVHRTGPSGKIGGFSVDLG